MAVLEARRNNMKKRPGIFAYISLIIYIIGIAVLVFEAATPGEKSAAQSNAVGNTLADFFNDVEGDQTVAVIPESLEITNKVETGFIGDTYKIEYSIIPNDSTFKSCVFTSSDNSVASINNDGLISFKNEGTTTISVINERYPSISDSFDVTVYSVDAVEIYSSIPNAAFNDEYYTLYIGKEYSIKTLFTPENTTIKDVEYIFNKTYLKVSDEGVITPVSYSANKVVPITVKHFELETTINVIIDYENVTKLNSLSISIPNNRIYVGQKLKPTIKLEPSNATFNSYEITSSNSQFVKVNKTELTGVKEGTVDITVRSTVYDDVSATITLTVLPQPTMTDFSVTTKSLFVNEQVKLSYKLVPEYAKSPTSITYESLNPNIATISSNGTLKGISIGKAKIKITMNSIVKTFEVTVKSDEITGNEDFTLNVKNSFLSYGKKYLIKDIFEVTNWYPETPRDKTISYTFKNELSGTITSDSITLNNLGSNTIYVTHDYSNITKVVELNCVDYNYLTLDSNNVVVNSINIFVNESFYFYISDNQEFTEENPQTYHVVSSNEAIASVSTKDDGFIVKSLDEGEATINVNSYIDGVQTNSVSINLTANHVYSSFLNYQLYNNGKDEEVIVENDEVSIFISGDYSLNALTSIDTTKKQIRYHSSNPKVLKVDTNGNLTCTGIGDATITITDELSNLSRTIKFSVYNYIKLDTDNPFTITGENLEVLNNLYYAMTNGFSGNIKVNFTENTTYKDVVYSSSNESVATIGKDGTITPLKVGETTIKVVIDDGMQNKIEFDIKLRIKRQDYIKNLTDFIYKVRKGVGHFSAFLVLGIFSTFTWLLFIRGKKLFISIPLNYLLGFLIAGLTEFIQLYVPGRCGLFADVLLDFDGFMVSSTIITIILIIKNIRDYIIFLKKDI